MKLEFFIAQRLVKAKSNKSNVSGPIIKIAITAIVISMIMMIVSVATGIGLQEKIREKIGAFHGHIIISNFDNNNSEVSITPITVSDDLYDYVKNINGISHVQAVATTGGIIRTEEAFEGIILKGVDKNFYWNQLQEYVIDGELPKFEDGVSNEIAISEFLANRLNLKVGDSFNTFFLRDNADKLPFSRRFKIAAIYNSGLADYDANYIIGDIRHVQRFNKWKENQVGNLEAFVTDYKIIDEVGDVVYAEIPSTYNSYTIKQKFPNVFEWLELLDFNIIGIIFFMILISAVNMIVALLVLILERTQMIGVLKALGASNWSIRKIFLYNAAYLIVIGLGIGNIIGIGLIYLQKYTKVITLNPESYYVTYAPVRIDLMQIAALNIGTVFICLFILLIPSYIITKIAPSKAIKFQ